MNYQTNMPADLEAAISEGLAAEFLGLSVRTLQAKRVRGGGPDYIKIGRSVRYRKKDLIDYLDRHSTASTSAGEARS